MHLRVQFASLLPAVLQAHHCIGWLEADLDGIAAFHSFPRNLPSYGLVYFSKKGLRTMGYYAGQKLYCIDKNHPYYGKRVEVAAPYKENKDGTPVLCDPASGKIVELKEDQVSQYPPDERD